MLLRLALLAALVFLAAPAPCASACSCADNPMGRITLAVRGEVTSVEIREGAEHRRFGVATIAFNDVLRGPENLEIVRVSYHVSDGINCGVGFRQGERGFFTAGQINGVYIASL